MLSELPKLLDRNYAIAYATPSALFILALFLILYLVGYDVKSFYDLQIKSDPLLGTALITFSAWFLGLILSVLNRIIVRFLSGYGRYNPLKWGATVQLDKFNQLNQQIEQLLTEIYTLNREIHELKPDENENDDEFIRRREMLLANLQLKYNQVDQYRHKRSYRFPYYSPSSGGLILPRELGNIIRAFESYPRVMYGLDGVTGWSRLLYVIPKEAHEIISSAKSYFDLWINIITLGSILCLACSILALTHLSIPTVATALLVMAIVFALVIWGSFAFTKLAAITWGETVKAAYDVYLPRLSKELQYKVQPHNFEFWTDFSVATVYKAPHRLGLYESLSDFNDQVDPVSDMTTPQG